MASIVVPHPIYSIIKRCAHRYVKKCRSPLHGTCNAYNIDLGDIEKITPLSRSKHTANRADIYIASIRREGVEEDRRSKEELRVYSDGSGYEGAIGAAAILYRDGRPPQFLQYLLGKKQEHGVFEAKAVGVMLAAELLRT